MRAQFLEIKTAVTIIMDHYGYYGHLFLKKKNRVTKKYIKR